MQTLPSAGQRLRHSALQPQSLPTSQGHWQLSQLPRPSPQIAVCASVAAVGASSIIARAAPAQAADVAQPEASPSQPGTNGAQGSAALEAVPLQSGVGADYSALKAELAAGQFQKADDETRTKLIQLAGKDAIKRNWVYFSEVQYIPAEDLVTIDSLWKAASNGKFGFSPQKEVWQQNRKFWTKFFKAISWVTGERNNYRKWPADFIYSLEAPKGHLPLTNCLRGTQLFEAILTHPAFEQTDQRPDWLK